MNTAYANQIIVKVVRRLTELYGNPTRTTQKVTEWGVQPGFSIVVENNQPKDEANVWVPYKNGSQPIPSNAIPYSENDTRHSNTYPAPGLEKGEPVILWKIQKDEDLEEVIRYIRTIGPIP